MKIIIAGSRTITNKETVFNLIDKANTKYKYDITEVVSGGCEGVDLLGEQWAIEHGIPVRRFMADWKTFGKSGGPVRNREMANYADGLIAIRDWSNESKGTQNMIQEAKRKKLITRVFHINSMLSKCFECGNKSMALIESAGDSDHLVCPCGYDMWTEPLDGINEIALTLAQKAEKYVENMKGGEEVAQDLYGIFVEELYDSEDEFYQYFFGD